MNRPKKSDPLFPEMDSDPSLAGIAAGTGKSANAPRQALQRVNAGFVAFVVAGFAASALAYPRLADRQRVDALADLAQLPANINVPALKSQMATKAELELAFDLERVARAVALPELTATQGSGPLSKLQIAEVPALASLGELAHVSKSGARFAVRGPDPDALANSLRWRLARQREVRPYVLTGLRLSHAVGLQAVDAEAVVEPARVEALHAVAAYDQSYAHYTELRDRSDELAKRGLSKKEMLPAIQERVAAYELHVVNKAAMLRTGRTYAHRSARALRRDASAPAQAGAGSLVIATLHSEGEKPWEVKIPMARTAQFATMPPFPGPVALTRLESNALWSEIRGLDALGATQQLEGQVSFHLRSIQIAGVRISGLAFLQALPLLLLFLAWMLTRACRTAARAYNPFGSNQGARLPALGSGSLALDRALLLSLPVAVCSLVCIALLRVHALPWFAAALLIPLVAQSLVAARMWKEQHRLLDIARNRSLVQPLPERAVAAVAGSRLTRT